jgi:hypothetical protein
MTSGPSARLHRDLIITLAARHKLPAVYTARFFVAAGGLMSYAPDFVDQYRQAAGYVDRILKGEKQADLPVLARRASNYIARHDLISAKVGDADIGEDADRLHAAHEALAGFRLAVEQSKPNSRVRTLGLT